AAGASAGLAEAHRASIMIGRTLLQQAVPVTFGLVAAGWLTSLDEARAGLAVLPWHADRLRVIDLGAALARAAAALGKIARDVTLLAQSEVGEVSEGPGPEQRGPEQQGAAASPRRGGSSAMP